MKNIYLYDDSFSSLLNLINKLLELKIIPLDIKTKKDFTPTLLDEPITLELNKSFNIQSINVSKKIIKTVYYVYLSTDPKKELIIYYFLLNALKYQDKIFYMRNLKCVNSTLKLAKRISNECHKLKGFLRFKEMNNHVLYAEASPTNNVLELLSNHFAKRLKNEIWIIKDVGRNMYSIYYKPKYYIVSGQNLNIQKFNISCDEENIEKLWLSFFKTIGIEARKNSRCQMNFMPKKYWPYIIEMERVYEKSNNG